MMRRPPLTAAALFFFACALPVGLRAQASAPAIEQVDFLRDVKPILESGCVHCHGPKEQEGDFRIDSKADAFKGNENGPGVTPGKPDESAIYTTIILPPDDDLVMPPKKGKQLSKLQTEVIKKWIADGANWPDGVVLVDTPRVFFMDHVLPLLKRGGPFNPSEMDTLRRWTAQGAVWPDGFVLSGGGDEGPKDDIDLVKKVRELIEKTSTEKSESDMKPYTGTISKTGVNFEMVVIPGGEFTMGSRETEKAHKPDESPQFKAKIDPFWMGKFEVTWDMYEPFMITDVPRNKDGSPQKINAEGDPVSIVSSPTTPYTEMSFGMGTTGYPAISMTEHAALKFCEWLSAQTGHYYRLPTEAEWEYACRAGTTTAYSFGDDASKLGDYAVFNADAYAKVGTKKPNPWGLYDMHGNVLEWCLDQYSPDAYKTRASGKTELNPFNKPKTIYPRVARGGSWYDLPEDCRSATRIFSDEAWKQTDPQLPKSIWYHTDAQWLGFRLVRPLKVPTAVEMHEIWNLGVKNDGGGAPAAASSAPGVEEEAK